MFLLKISNEASGHSFIIAFNRCSEILKTTLYFFFMKMSVKLMCNEYSVTYNYIIRPEGNFVRVLFQTPAGKIHFFFGLMKIA